ncbi:hypothetical protein LguiA_029379 [Lonicera macranthoides]
MEKAFIYIAFSMILFSVISNGLASNLNNHTALRKNQPIVWPVQSIPRECIGAAAGNICFDRLGLKGCIDDKCGDKCLNQKKGIAVVNAFCESANTCMCCYAC